jgi:hypothetical protein
MPFRKLVELSILVCRRQAAELLDHSTRIVAMKRRECLRHAPRRRGHDGLSNGWRIIGPLRDEGDEQVRRTGVLGSMVI